MTPTQFSASAPAKINLTLEVLGPRADGYHELRSVMQTLEVADYVTIDLDSRERGVAVSGRYAGGAPADATNLAWVAAEKLAAATGRDLGRVRIAIVKNLPAAAGVGGGASDAATTLRLLARAWAVEDRSLLLETANAIGSDEAFFLTGGTALVTGRGDIVAPLARLGPHDVVLFVPPASIANKTGSLFKALAKTPFDDGQETERFLSGHPRLLAIGETYNAFERVAFGTFEGLAELRTAIEAATGHAVRLAGAGPTLFWLGPPGEGKRVAAAAVGLGCDVISTRTAN